MGLTGADAFDALRDTLLHRVGDGGSAHPALDGFALQGEGDLLGLAYERFFPDLFKGRVGQFFTPPAIVRLLLARLPLGPGVRVIDPTCGSGGLLVPAGRTGASVTGLDVDPRMVDLATLNLRLARLTGDVRRADVFAAEPRPVDVLVANPPFSVPIDDPEVLRRYALADGRERVVSDVLFLEAIERWVVPGGLAALVLPWTIIANPRLAPVRDRVDAHWRRLALCALPEGVFRPFGGAAGRAALLWLQRRPCAEGPMAWSALDDPGYDVRSTALKSTSNASIDRLIDGVGWVDVPGWLPEHLPTEGVPVRDWARTSTETAVLDGSVDVLELADADRRTGEVRLRREHVRGRRPIARGGQVLVARMRPELGNVAWVPEGAVAAVSPEWIRLVAEHHPRWLFHALRSPAWRAGLPPTTGQTRPRTDAEAVGQTRIPAPPLDVLDRVEALSARWMDARERLRVHLEALQDAVDGYVAGELDADALSAALTALEDG